MWRFLLLFTFCLLHAGIASIKAQSDSVRFFNFYWKPTTRDSAAYYREVEKETRFYRVRDYYVSGMLQMEGTYSSLNPEIQQGYFTWYFENGQKFAEGNYVRGEREGIWTFWFPDGLKREEIRFYPGRAGEYSVKWQSKRMKNSQQLIDRAADESSPDKAISLLDAALQINPFSGEAYFEKALIELKNGKEEEGCAHLRKAREYWYNDMMTLSELIEKRCFEK